MKNKIALAVILTILTTAAVPADDTPGISGFKPLQGDGIDHIGGILDVLEPKALDALRVILEILEIPDDILDREDAAHFAAQTATNNEPSNDTLPIPQEELAAELMLQAREELMELAIQSMEDIGLADPAMAVNAAEAAMRAAFENLRQAPASATLERQEALMRAFFGTE